MTHAPRIALVIPAYNAAQHLARLFDTVRAQHESFDQIIVCDDASTDDTSAVAERLGARVERLARNAGCSAAKNTGLAAVRCDWVHFHDADDLLAPEFVAAARSDLALGTIDAWLPRWRHIDATTGAVLGDSALDAAKLRDDPIGFHLRHTVNNVGVYRVALVRRAGGFDEDAAVLHNEDRAFHLKLARAGARFGVSEVLGVITQRHGRSMSQTSQVRCLRSHAAITLAYLAEEPERHASECASALWQAAQGLATYGELTAAHELVRRAQALGYAVDPNGSARFRWLCRVNPHLALQVREYAVRWFKPHLRAREGSA